MAHPEKRAQRQLSPRRTTTPVTVGGVIIGGGAPVSVQTMTNTDTSDVQATLKQIRRSVGAGAQIVRVAVPDMDAAEALPELIEGAGVPIVADIHFDYRLAVAAAEAGVHKLRINPGNIGSDERVQAVVDAAADNDIPIRIGVNAGSLEKKLLEKHGHPTPEALAESALRNVNRVRDMGFEDIVVSIKASDVPMTVAANRIFAQQTALPLHLGITEAGTGRSGVVHSAVGIGVLLADGIGDTIRVSLTGDVAEEVRVGREILLSLGLVEGARLVSCPTCGRCRVDLPALARDVQKIVDDIDEPLLVAVMGCEVNGPGEAREADVGLAAGRGRAAIFRHGEIIRTVNMSDALAALRDEIDAFLDDRRGCSS
ncbi:MAG: flavodoxin-dependent (E)-4-hydroxy-3-methylbut-2-enyl-diphosphate synthase [Armatimonadota bacterium]